MGLFDFFRKKTEKPVEQVGFKPGEKKDERPLEQKRETPLQQKKEKPVEQRTAQHQSRTNAQMQRPAQRAQQSGVVNKPVGTKPAGSQTRDYTIKAGDSLSRIARQFYGNANDWQKIYQANRNKIKNPNVIHPGQKIIIP